MARKLDDDLNCFEEQEEDGFDPLTQSLDQEPLFGEWLRRNPRWTTDRLMDLGAGDSRDME